MKLHAMMVVLVATATACSPAPTPTYRAPDPVAATAAPTTLSPAAEKNLKARAEAWVDCAADKAKQLDDGRSDAGSIAQAVRSACRSLYPLRDNDDLGYATQLVLQVRANDPDTLKAAISPAWANCTDPFLQVEHIQKFSVNTVAITAAEECKRHFQGRSGQDLKILTIVAKQRLDESTRGPVVGKPQPLPPVDKRM